MADDHPDVYPQLVVVYEHGDTLQLYATAYTEADCHEVTLDCRAKHGTAKVVSADDLKKAP